MSYPSEQWFETMSVGILTLLFAGGEGDATAYVRNLFNVPVIAYSGENDRQLQASRVMEEAYAREGMHLPHLIGPGMGHAVRIAVVCSVIV